MIAMASEKTRNPNSEAQDLSVYPRIRRPWECLENLNTRNTLYNGITFISALYVYKKLSTYKDSKSDKRSTKVFVFLNFKHQNVTHTNFQLSYHFKYG